jgi:transcriptional regulator with XRE-family HTH domain
MDKRKINSFDKFVLDLTGDESILQDIDKHRRATSLVALLENERVRKKLTQKDIAERMGVSVSTVSRFEDTPDDDLNLGDMKAYMAALGMNMSMMICEEKVPSAARIKHCVFEIKRLLTKLTEYAKNSQGDQELCDAISKFQGEVLFNFLMKYVESGADPTSFFVEVSSQTSNMAQGEIPFQAKSPMKQLAAV